ncbi:hypothetical protein [Legionella rowbothamii]|uniref:hypothetical protein n=1 Tax=Legionella rowbothamii TaxID=96229 RepID=UPI0010563FB7|nr:hypothetical protein [Legionella rowbothamii]
MGRKQDLQRLIDLRKITDALTQEQEKELKRLKFRFIKDSDLPISQLEAKLIELETTTVSASSENIEELIADFNEAYAGDEHYEEPKVEDDNTVSLKFSSKEECAKFFMKQCEKGQAFVMFDPATKNVTAYSNGDGKLYHADGKEFKEGDEFKPSEKTKEDFEIPGLPPRSIGTP